MVESTRLEVRARWTLAFVLLALSGAGVLPRAAGAQQRLESETYPVSAFRIEYALEHPAQPDPAELLQLEVELRSGTGGGLLPPHPSVPSVRFRLGDVPPGSRFYPGALRQVNRLLLDELTRLGFGGVLVTMPELDEEKGRDLRQPGETVLKVLIWIGRVEEVATLADSERFGDESLAARTNRPEHTWIREGSPVTAGGDDAVLRPDSIEDYAARLSRQPGRDVRPMLRPGAIPGASRLEYHVAEQKPWQVYAQVSNTGTEATTDWRERFGFSHTQLTGNDDVLRFDYVTGNFDSVHAVWGEYGGPLWHVPRARWLLEGSWSRYDSSEVGISQIDFKGDEWYAGGRMQYNVFQHRDIFVDLFAGARWQRTGVDNPISGDREADFFLPRAGIYAERVGEVWSFMLESGVSHNLSSVADTGDAQQLARLGRENVEPDFTLLDWHGELSFFPAPLLRRFSWSDSSDLGAYDFAHELSVEAIGQTSFGDRLVPQLQQVAGGLYTVRGYDQSVAAGDTVAIVRAEYRVHLPRLLYPDPDAPKLPLLGTFRVRPENAFAFPDWDLIASAFTDSARVVQHDGSTAVEPNETMHTLGFGMELRVLRYLSARLDLAWPQRRLTNNDPTLDKPKLHGVVTVLY